MEKAKASKKKSNKHRKPDSTSSKKHSDWGNVGKNNHEQSAEILNDHDSPQEKSFSKRPLQQPKSRLGDLDEIWQETNVGQDFGILVGAPVSTGSFVFKSEKNWTLDASKYDDFFSLDVKNLSAIISCIPFNELIGVDTKYFSKDELSYINSTAEQAKKTHNEKLEALRREKLANDLATHSEASEENDDTNPPAQSSKPTAEEKTDDTAIEDDLDYLLSLKAPVRAQPVAVNVACPLTSDSKDMKVKTIPAATKSKDLESWLDMVLDD